ncbi:putative bifunctional diguanylate cyclase/phosphodiesterase [Luminiphilus syltensis]|nr:GGDEF domain-containing phosphodiesterase [Luminiphilus syltensis]
MEIQRSACIARLEEIVASGFQSGRCTGLLLIDLNNLRQINHRHSFRLGDVMINEVLETLRAGVKDCQNVFRIGGHTFAVVLPDLEFPGYLSVAAARLSESLADALEMESDFTPAKVHIGASVSAGKPASALDMLARAEMHLERVREDRGLAFESTAITDDVSSFDEQLGRQFEQALHRSEFEVYFQPQVSTATGAVLGAEALLRWSRAEQGFVSPERVIHLAAQSGKTFELARSIINNVARNAKAWCCEEADFKVAINVSADLLGTVDLVDILDRASSIWDVPHKNLTIEITEQTLVSDIQSSKRLLRDLRDRGYGISIDDFGTGYSSLSYLRQLPATELKIDRSFVNTLLLSDEDRELVRIIVDMGHLFGMQVVAEGVENLETRYTLEKMGCDVLQGYLIGHPMPAVDFESWRRDWTGWLPGVP